MAQKYMKIPVSEQVYEKFLRVCSMNKRKQGAQVEVWADGELAKVGGVKEEAAPVVEEKQ